MDDSSQAPSAAGFFPGKFTQGDRDGRHEASGIRNMTAHQTQTARTMRTRTAIMVSKRRSPQRNRTGRASPFLSALILEGIALLAIIAIARPDLIQTLVVRWNPQPTQLQNSFDSPYTSNVAIDRPGVYMTQRALSR